MVSAFVQKQLFLREDGPGEAKGKQNYFKKKNMNLSCIFKTEKLALSKINEKELILFFSEREDLKANPFMILKS